MIIHRPLHAIAAIAVNTFREAVRNKVLLSLVFFAVALSLFSVVLGEMSLHEERRVTIDFSLFLSTIFSVLIAIHSSVTLLHTELERRTIYTIVSKPIPRWQFLVGKFFGVMLLSSVVVALMFTVSVVLLLLQNFQITSTFALAHVTLLLQLLIVTALALFFASFSSPLLSGMFTAAAFIIGNLTSQLDALKAFLKEQGRQGFDGIIDAVKITLPNFESLNLAPQATYAEPVPLAYIGSAVWYASAYAAIVIVAAVFIFGRRDFS